MPRIGPSPGALQQCSELVTIVMIPWVQPKLLFAHPVAPLRVRDTINGENMAVADGSIGGRKTSASLLDEIEQLNTALESALDENAVLIEDRDRLLRRVAELTEGMRAAQDM